MATKKTKRGPMFDEPREAVIICTDKRGVFFGYPPKGAKRPLGPEAVCVLADARQCVYWHASIGGVLGLGATGPNAQCRIGKAVPRLTCVGIHCYIDCAPEAVAAWERAPWA